MTPQQFSEICTNIRSQVGRVLLGLDGDLGPSLGLDKDWAVQVITQVGNFGEMEFWLCLIKIVAIGAFVLLALLIGWTVPVVGALVRYRIPLLPFVGFAALLLVDASKLPRWFPLKPRT